MKLKAAALMTAMLVLAAGCSPASRARGWAEQAVAETWEAQYHIAFHQEDGDIVMNVCETRGETLELDIAMPNGTLRLEYGPDNLLINLDQGGLEWEDLVRQPPYYTLSELSRQITAAGKLTSTEDWADVFGYLVKVEDGKPIEVKYKSEWTLYVEEFLWNQAGS